MQTARSGATPRARVLLAFAAVYLIWGSTYLAIRVSLETMPPFLMAAVRFLAAGAILYLWARWRGAPAPRAVHWRSAAVVGGLLLLGGNGGVVWAQQRGFPSGLAALVIATVPLWMVLLGWRSGQGSRPTTRVILGLVLGMAGMWLLFGARGADRGSLVDPMAAAVLVAAALSWAYGSLWSRNATLPSSPLLATSMEMLTGGALLALAGLASGEWARLDPTAVSARSLVALLYLVVFGSLVGFTAYIFLLSATTPTRASTYAFVNPVVALILGWAVAGEALTARAQLAAAVILSGVVLLVTAGARPPVQPAPDAERAEPVPDARRAVQPALLRND